MKEKIILTCQICDQTFTLNQYKSGFFNRHIKKQHNLTPKQYYDLYLIKENENPNNDFISILKGYKKIKNVFLKCKHNNCNKEFSRGEYLNGTLTRHLKKEHGLSLKQYYDLYLIKENENLNNNFISLEKGYSRTKVIECGICKEKILRSSLRRHLKEKHNNISEKEYIFKYIKKIKKYEKCIFCGDIFKTKKALYIHLKKIHLKTKEQEKNYYDIYIKKENENKCLFCKKETNFLSLKQGYFKTCNHNCASKYGAIQNKEAWKNLSTDEKEKRRLQKQKTCLEKYGVKHHLQIPEIYEKVKNTLKEKYGYEYMSQVPEIIEKIKNTCIKKYGVEHFCQSKEYLEFFKNEEFNIKRKLKEYETKKKNGTLFSSKEEKSIQNFLKENKLKIKCPDRKILNGLEIDILIPDKKIGIEINGTFWHSELMGKTKKYHLNKTKLTEKKDYQLLHIFDMEWHLKKNIIKSILLSKLGLISNKIYARKCIIKDISAKEKNIFLENNHIQGPDKSNIKLGLYYNNELVSLMTFSKPRYNKKYNWELSRFCNKIDYTVIGGFSKLFKYFIKHYTGSIITYADRRYSNGNVYEKNGFKFLHDSNPNYYYFHNTNTFLLESRVKYQKHKLKNILENFNNDLSEWENMMNNGYNRIWDCGNKVYEFNK